MGYVAVALIALTGAINTLLLVGSLGAMFGTPYGRLLSFKVLPRRAPRTGSYRRPRAEFGLAVLVIVSVLGPGRRRSTAATAELAITLGRR
jgi:hypothetical protein